MSPVRRIVLALLPLAAIVGGFWFMVLAPTRAQISAVQAEIVQATSRRDVAVAAGDLADQARLRYPRDYATVLRLAEAVPTDEDVAALVRGLDAVARANGIDFRAIKLSAAAAEEPPAAADSGETAGATEGEGGEKSGEEGGEAGAEAKGEPAPESDAAVPAAGIAVGAAGLLTMPFTFTADGSYASMQRFLKALHARAKHAQGRIEVNGRLLTIDGFSFAAGRKGFPSIRALITATAYLEPDPGGLLTGATWRGPAAVPAAAPPANGVLPGSAAP